MAASNPHAGASPSCESHARFLSDVPSAIAYQQCDTSNRRPPGNNNNLP